MRGSLSHARLLTAAVVALVAAAAGASSALATSATTSANGVAVSASLSPDTVAKSGRITQDATVKNTSDSTQTYIVRIFGPRSTAAPFQQQITLGPGKLFESSASFSAGQLSSGTHSLDVVAVNRSTGAVTEATATVKVN